MSRSFGLKFIVALITALALVVGAGSVLAVVYLGEYDLYTETPQELTQRYLEDLALNMGDNLAQRYTTEKYGSFPEGFPEHFNSYESYLVSEKKAYYTLLDENRNVLETNVDPQIALEKLYHCEFTVGTEYPVAVSALSDFTDATFPAEYFADAASTDPTLPMEEYLHDSYLEDENNLYHIYYYRGPEIIVQTRLTEDAWTTYSSDYWWAVNLLYSLRYWFVLGVILGVGLFLAGISYLTWAVGTRKGREGVKLVGLNRLPLDIYGAAIGGIGFAFLDLSFLTRLR